MKISPVAKDTPTFWRHLTTMAVPQRRQREYAWSDSMTPEDEYANDLDFLTTPNLSLEDEKLLGKARVAKDLARNDPLLTLSQQTDEAIPAKVQTGLLVDRDA